MPIFILKPLKREKPVKKDNNCQPMHYIAWSKEGRPILIDWQNDKDHPLHPNNKAEK